MIWGSPVLYRDHQMGPGGPPGGATHPGGPHGLKWEGGPALSGLVRPQGPPPAPRVGTLGWGGRPLALGGTPHPLAAAPLEIGSPQGRRPPQGAYIKGGRERQPHP